MDDFAQRQRADYARELKQRFEQYQQWAIAHWPVAEQPLDEAAFVAARRELELMTGAMLHPGEADGAVPAGKRDGGFEDVTPAPWP